MKIKIHSLQVKRKFETLWTLHVRKTSTLALINILRSGIRKAGRISTLGNYGSGHSRWGSAVGIKAESRNGVLCVRGPSK